MKLRGKLLATSFASLTSFAACHSPTASTPTPVCPPGYVTMGSMSAVIDGVTWVAGCVAPAGTYLGTSLYIAGLDQALDSGRAQAIAIQISLPQIPTPQLIVPGSYLLGGPANPYANSYAILNRYCTPNLTAAACSEWMAREDFGDGTVTIASFTSTMAAGTFSLNLLPVGNAAGTKVVTNGMFNVTF